MDIDEVAFRSFAIPATSLPNEKDVSVMEDLLSQELSRLLPPTLASIIVAQHGIAD